MPWTESRSREEWLAEVQRRGTRIRRRRRVGFGVVGALALVLPVGVTATVLSGGADRAVELSVAGPAPAGDRTPAPAPPNELATGEVPAVATTAVDPPTTIAEPQSRVGSAHGRTEPPTATGAPPGDDPLVRPPTPTTIPSGNSSSPALTVPAATTVPPASTEPAPAPCASSEVRVTVATEKAGYGPGEAVRGSSTLENRSTGACLLPTRGFFKVLNAAGKDVGNFAYTADFRFPVRAEPGKTFTSTFTWDQRDCTGSACVQVPPGTYTVVADWTESGPYTASTTLQVTS